MYLNNEWKFDEVWSSLQDAVMAISRSEGSTAKNKGGPVISELLWFQWFQWTFFEITDDFIIAKWNVISNDFRKKWWFQWFQKNFLKSWNHHDLPSSHLTKEEGPFWPFLGPTRRKISHSGCCRRGLKELKRIFFKLF